MAESVDEMEDQDMEGSFDHLLSYKIFSNHVLTDEIFKNVNHHSDLLHCSLVNKSWNAFFRKILRQRGNLLSIRKCETFEELETVTKMFESSELIGFHPFGGVKIYYPEDPTDVFNKHKYWDHTEQNLKLMQRIFSVLKEMKTD